MNMQNTAKIILQKRKELQMTQKDIAEKLNVSVAAVSKWERGLNYPDLSLMEPLANILNITVSELLQLENKPTEQIIKNITQISQNQIIANRKTALFKICSVVLSIFFSWLIYFSIINNQIVHKLFFENLGTGILNIIAFAAGIIALCFSIAAVTFKNKIKRSKCIITSIFCCAIALHIPTLISYLILRFEYAATLQDIIGGYYFGSAVLLTSTIIFNAFAIFINKK